MGSSSSSDVSHGAASASALRTRDMVFTKSPEASPELQCCVNGCSAYYLGCHPVGEGDLPPPLCRKANPPSTNACKKHYNQSLAYRKLPQHQRPHREASGLAPRPTPVAPRSHLLSIYYSSARDGRP